MEDLYSRIGVGMMCASNIVSRLKEESIDDKEKHSKELVEKNIEEQIHKNEKKQSNENNYGVTVKGLSNIMVRFAKCCNPVPGDEVVGYITKGRGVSIHRKDCNNIKASFGKEKGAGYLAEVQINAEDRMGIISDVMQVITEKNLPLMALNANSSKGNVAIINLKVKINSIEQLKEFMKNIRKIKGVNDVYRMNN